MNICLMPQTRYNAPTKNPKNTVCSICGKKTTRNGIGRHKFRHLERYLTSKGRFA